MRCASPPESVGLCWPGVREPRPASCSSCRQRWIEACAEKNPAASSTFIANTSPPDLPRSFTASVSALKRAPPQASQLTLTSGRKDMAIFFIPWPSHSSQRPPLVLNEKRLPPAAHARLGGIGEQAPDRVPEADVGGGAGARRLADRRLVDLERALDSVGAVHRLAA